MVGRELTAEASPEGVREDRESILEVEGLSTKELLKDVSFPSRRARSSGSPG